MASLKITFLGHASFRLESNRSVTYFDAWLDNNPTAKAKVAQIKKADIVVATHGHNDHIGDSYEICKRTRAKFVGNYELCAVAEQAHGLKMGARALPMNPGGSVKVKDVRLTMTQAHHSQSLSPNVTGGPLPDGLLYHPDSAVSGFVMAYDNGITVYDTADTCLFSDMQLIGQMYGPQVAIMPVGGQFTMGVREAARAASFIRPDVVIPCHYGETMGQPADIGELGRQVAFLSPGTKVAELKVGQTLTYTASSFKVGR